MRPDRRTLLAALALAGLMPFWGTAATAQGTGLTFGGMRESQDEPIEMRADNLQVNNVTGESIFTGNAVIAQGDMRMAAPEIRIYYTPGDRRRIVRVEGYRGVTLITAEEAAEGETGVYFVDDGVIHMTGSVLVTQGPNIITGDRLRVNVDTGEGVMEGNVRSIVENFD